LKFDFESFHLKLCFVLLVVTFVSVLAVLSVLVVVLVLVGVPKQQPVLQRLLLVVQFVVLLE
jgi:hypothetical protein